VISPTGLDEDWVVTEREAFRRRCVALLDQLSKMEIVRGAHAEAATLLRKRIDLEPLEEVGYRALLHALGLAGDRAAAVQTFHRGVAVLDRELNVEPDPRTIEEYERLVATDVVATNAGKRRSASRLPAKNSPLIGRGANSTLFGNAGGARHGVANSQWSLGRLASEKLVYSMIS
jgi:DNA-binding SARP family transcriptional activator